MRIKHSFIITLSLLLGALSAQAQWITQSFALKAGWNAIYLHVDASHSTLQELVCSDTNNAISDVWAWTPAASPAFQLPADDSSQWACWSRSSPDASLLQRMAGNVAYLVRVYTNVPAYTWKIKGHPVPPNYQWTSAGINLIGFSTPTNNPPTIYNFLAKSGDLKDADNALIYRYTGGEWIYERGITNTPSKAVTTYLSSSITFVRGQAFWFCRTNLYNNYFGPFEIDLTSRKGVDFADTLSVRSFYLRNLTATNLTVTLKLSASETPPVGQTNIVCVPPLLLRGALNATNLTYACQSLATNASRSWTLAGKGKSGSEVEIVLGLNRSAMAGQAGDLQAGVLSLTDSLGHTKVDIPVSASVATDAGLWVGNALVTQVGEYLKSYASGANGAPEVGTNGAYVVTNTVTRLGSVPRAYPLRLIVHNPAAGGNAVLLQRVFCGLGERTNAVVATSEEALNPTYLKNARRISATHLPWSAANTYWTFDGNLDQASLAVTVTTGYDDQASNPFVHTYHPDHDNFGPTFSTQLPQGAESYTLQRTIVLTPTAPTGDFDSYVSKGKTVSGDYDETITVLGRARAFTSGTDTREFHVRGVFSLNRVTDVPTLTHP
jgi:hypothetical protein